MHYKQRVVLSNKQLLLPTLRRGGAIALIAIMSIFAQHSATDADDGGRNVLMCPWHNGSAIAVRVVV